MRCFASLMTGTLLTGPMTRDELKDLACLGFTGKYICASITLCRLSDDYNSDTADLVMQSFCHTAAYPKPGESVMYICVVYVYL